MADTMPDTSGTPAPAAGELTIPKSRLDEALAKIRRLEESESIKDQLYLQRERQFAASQQPQAQAEETAEDVGLDPQTYQGVKKLASRIAEKMVREREAYFGQQIGILANRTEKAELIANRGAGKAKYIPEIERLQKEHASRTGTFLPADIALSILESSEKDERIRALEARLAGNEPTPRESAVTPDSRSQGPSAAGTRQIPTGGGSGAPANKSFSDLSVEEMEARLEEQFKSGTRA